MNVDLRLWRQRPNMQIFVFFFVGQDMTSDGSTRLVFERLKMEMKEGLGWLGGKGGDEF